MSVQDQLEVDLDSLWQNVRDVHTIAERIFTQRGGGGRLSPEEAYREAVSFIEARNDFEQYAKSPTNAAGYGHWADELVTRLEQASTC